MGRVRASRVGEAVREELSDLIRTMKDPRVGFASIVDVEVSPDLRHCKVFVSIYGSPEEQQQTLLALQSARGFLRSELAGRIRMRHAPELDFRLDRSLAHGDRIHRLINQLHRDSGQPPEPGGPACSGPQAGAREAQPRVEGDLNEVLAALREAQRILMVIHVRPDGDSIGSTLALAAALRRLGKQPTLVRVDDIPENLAFLPGAEAFRPWQEAEGPFDLAVFLDCGGLDRIGPARGALPEKVRILNVDHHLSNSRFGHINYLEPDVAAAGEIVYRIIAGLGVALDYEIAVGLYTAIATDTGSFQFESTSPRTHRVVAELLEAGVQPAEVAHHVWENRPLRVMRLLQRALASLEVDREERRLAYLSVTEEDLQASGARWDDTEGLVGYARSLEGVEVALLFVEEPDKIKVSLRSNKWVNVSRIAASFGGGGHARAAGCQLRLPLAEARRRVLEAVREVLAEGA